MFLISRNKTYHEWVNDLRPSYNCGFQSNWENVMGEQGWSFWLPLPPRFRAAKFEWFHPAKTESANENDALIQRSPKLDSQPASVNAARGSLTSLFFLWFSQLLGFFLTEEEKSPDQVPVWLSGFVSLFCLVMCLANNRFAGFGSFFLLLGDVFG